MIVSGPGSIAQGRGGWSGLALSPLQLCVHLSTAKAMVGRDQDCLLPVEEAGVLWDSVCFVSLLLQRRVFLSRYFLHVRAELKASAQLASRLGATGHLWSAGLLPRSQGPRWSLLSCPLALVCTLETAGRMSWAQPGSGPMWRVSRIVRGTEAGAGPMQRDPSAPHYPSS